MQDKKQFIWRSLSQGKATGATSYSSESYFLCPVLIYVQNGPLNRRNVNNHVEYTVIFS